MQFFTPERKKNLEWWNENEETLKKQYDGKYVLIHNRSIIAAGSGRNEMIKKAEHLELKVEDYIIMIVGSAVDHDIVEMGMGLNTC